MEPSLTNALLIFVAGVVTGTLGAVLGTGGGVFLIPILVLGLKVPMHLAVATSIVSVVATSSAVASSNVERGIANMRLGMTLEIATVLGGISGGLTAAYLAPAVLEGLFAVVLLPTAILMWRGRPGSRLAPQAKPTADDRSLGVLGACYHDELDGHEVCYRLQRLWAGLGISFGAGNLSGLLGIGGGVFKVPALHLLCGMPMKAAAATSNFMIGVTAAASAFLYYGRGEVRPRLTAMAVLGVLVGSAFGATVNRRVRGAAVRKLFAALLFLVALQMLYRALTQGSHP